MASGVSVDDDCKEVFQAMKLKKNEKYIIFRLNDELTKIVVEKKADKSATYEQFIDDLKVTEGKKQCRYAVFDAKYHGAGAMEHQKLCFFFWSPECATVKQKMVYATSKEALKKALGEGIHKEIQANDFSDLDWNCVLEKISSTDRH